MTHDYDLRAALMQLLPGWHPGAKILPEMGVVQSHAYSSARVDIAAIGELLIGYELKSDADNLSRLGRQAEIYGTVFNRMTLVAGRAHLEHAKKLVPEWWGLCAAFREGPDIVVEAIRAPEANPAPLAEAQLRLLWSVEIAGLLRSRKLLSGRAGPKDRLRARVLASLTAAEVQSEVCRVLSTRFWTFREQRAKRRAREERSASEPFLED